MTLAVVDLGALTQPPRCSLRRQTSQLRLVSLVDIDCRLDG
jgi:hypothetical protein